MAKKQAGRVRFDEFVGGVRPDPAKPEPLLLLAGYVGRGGEAGRLRIHPDASLNQWYEVADEDVVHSAPIGDSPLGGSNIWLKASARIGYGVAVSPPQTSASEATAPDTTAPAAGAPIALGAAPPPFTQQLCPTTMPPGCGLPGPAVVPTQSLIACMPMPPQVGLPTQSVMACMPMQPPGVPPTQSLMACMPMQPQGTLPTAPTLFCQPAMGLTFGGCSPPQFPSPPAWSVFCPPPPPSPPITSAGCPALPPAGPSWTLTAGCPLPFQPGAQTLSGCQGASVVFMCPPQ